MIASEFLNFLADLEDNNNREWFNANKKRFKEHVEAPWHALVTATIDAVSAVDPMVKITSKEAVFRIYKDTRFSKDKTPYKTQMTAVVAEGGRKGKKANGIYLEAKANAFRIYSGFYMPDKKDLLAVREAIAADITGFQAIYNEPKFKSLFGSINGDKNKRIPKEFNEVAEQEPLIFNKSFYVFNEMPSETLLQDDILDVIMEHFIVSKPLGDFFMDALSA